MSSPETTSAWGVGLATVTEAGDRVLDTFFPDPRLGEVGKAYVVPRPGHALAEADVLAFCRERLAGYKVPRRVEFRDALPRNPSGKVLKRVLKEEP